MAVSQNEDKLLQHCVTQLPTNMPEAALKIQVYSLFLSISGEFVTQYFRREIELDLFLQCVPAGSPSRRGDVTVYVKT